MIWVLFLVAMAAAFLFGGIESALIAVSRVRARHAASEGDRCAARLAALLERRPELLEASMAVHHFFSVTSFVTFAILCRHHWGDWGILAAVVIGTPLFLIGLELAPKSIFRLYPFRLLRRLTPILAALQTTAFIWRAPARVLEAAMDSPTPQALTPNGGLVTLVSNIAALRLLPPTATALLERYAALSPLTAGELSKSWNAISAVPAEMPLSSVLPLARQTGERHHPVLDANGEVIGFLDAAALPPHLPQDRFVRQFTQALPHLPMDSPALRCFQMLRKSGAPMALVTNGEPRAAGIITLQSLLTRFLNPPDKPGNSG